MRKHLYVDMPAGMHKALRRAALDQDRTLSAVAIEALEGWLEVNVADWSAPGGAEVWPEGDDVENREASSSCEHVWEEIKAAPVAEGNPWWAVVERCRACGEERESARERSA